MGREMGERFKREGIQTPSSNNTREDSTHGHHKMVNTEIRLIVFFAGNKNKSGS